MAARRATRRERRYRLDHSPVLGVAAAGAGHRSILLTAVSGLIAGAVLPMVVVVVPAPAHLMPWAWLVSIVSLAGLGALSAQVGGARVWSGMWRVAFWGTVAMAVTTAAGALFGALA